MNLHIYEQNIKELKPLTDSKFKYDNVRWKYLNIDYLPLINHYENLYISRQDVINSYKKFYNDMKEWRTPFLLTMIWGFADTGYGTYRTNNYLSNEANHLLIMDALQAVGHNELEIAYHKLKKIRGLNISYISKILYFASRACNYEEYALIYDIRVAKSLIKLSVIPEIYEIVEVKPSSKFKHYKQYNVLMHKYSKEIDVSAECLEMFLFEQKF